MAQANYHLQELRVKSWFLNPKYEDRKYNFPLTEDSVVFDLGGYEGEFAEAIFAKYHCDIYVFEPVKKFAEQIEAKFRDNNKIKVFAFGLYSKTKTEKISLLDNSSSVFKQNQGEKETIKLVNASEFIKENKIEKIDLLKLNIEGSEYPVLETLLESGDTEKVENILVQFHDFVDNAEERMIAIQKRLKKEFYPIFQYKFIWEGWTKRKDPDKLEQSELIAYTKKLQTQLDYLTNEVDLSHADALNVRIELKQAEAELEELKEKLQHEQNEHREQINKLDQHIDEMQKILDSTLKARLKKVIRRIRR